MSNVSRDEGYQRVAVKVRRCVALRQRTVHILYTGTPTGGEGETRVNTPSNICAILAGFFQP